MAVVYQTKKKTGVTYAYENRPYWDKEKKQSRAKRIPIGRVDPETGEIVPTREYKKRNTGIEARSVKPEPMPMTKFQRSFYGATYLLDQVGKLTGVEADIQACFPGSFRQILSIAYFLILEESNGLNRFSHWQRFHIHPHGDDIPSQGRSELFQSIREDDSMAFLKRQGRRRIEKEYWAFDITAVSSYSTVQKQVKSGANKERDRLPQINLGLLFGEQSGLPFYYCKRPGGITDVKAAKQLIHEFNAMDCRIVKVLLDRGFYSKTNLDALFKNHEKFIVEVKLSLKYVKEALKEERENLQRGADLQTQFGVCGICRTIESEYEQEGPYQEEGIQEKRRAYLLLFFSPEKAARDLAEWDDYISDLHSDLIQGDLKECRTKDYEKYFYVKEMPKGGRKVLPIKEAIDGRSRNHGFFALISNEVSDPYEALSLYRSKEIADKAFANLKERLDFGRTQVTSAFSLHGRLFVEFIALIYLSYVKKSMQDAMLLDRWTLQSLLDELDTIELVEASGGGRELGEMTETQKVLYQSMGVDPPSLHNLISRV